MSHHVSDDIGQLAWNLLADSGPAPRLPRPPDVRAMQEGRRRAARQRRRDAIKRVRDYERWLAAGSPFACIPTVPSDRDYKLARGQ